MDIRKEKFRLTFKRSNIERYFDISYEELMAILAGLGKPVSICLTDTAGEKWWIGLTNLQADVDMNEKFIMLALLNNYNKQ